MDLIIDLELKSYLPASSEQTDEALEAAMLEAGRAIDPIVVWKQRGVIVDGYRRYAICKKHNLPYTVEMIEFDDFPSVKSWMLRHFLTKRHVNSTDYAELLAEAVKLKTVGRRGLTKARNTVAKEMGVSERTVRRNVEFANALKTLPEGVRNDIRTGSLSATQGDVVELADYTPEEQEDIASQVRSGEFQTLGEAIRGEGNTKSKDSRPAKADIVSSLEAKKKTAQKALGQLAREVDKLKQHNAESYRDARKLLKDLGEVIDQWQNEGEF
jgi:ParB-like chromosome segregation protein Spo0J